MYDTRHQIRSGSMVQSTEFNNYMYCQYNCTFSDISYQQTWTKNVNILYKEKNRHYSLNLYDEQQLKWLFFIPKIAETVSGRLA